MTQENDIVLIHFESKPLTFARIEDISPDIKKDWYHVKLLILQVPVHVVTWILRDIYIDGEEFTMNGKRMRMERIICPEDPEIPEDEPEEVKIPENAKVISLINRKKKIT